MRHSVAQVIVIVGLALICSISMVGCSTVNLGSRTTDADRAINVLHVVTGAELIGSHRSTDPGYTSVDHYFLASPNLLTGNPISGPAIQWDGSVTGGTADERFIARGTFRTDCTVLVSLFVVASSTTPNALGANLTSGEKSDVEAGTADLLYVSVGCGSG